MNIEMSRRSFLKAAAGAAAAGGLAVTGVGGLAQGAQAAKAQQNGAVWVWQFDRDALADQVREALSQRSLGVIVKTHDGVDWMAKWDRSVHAIWGPEQVAWLARFFSERNVAFHAWCVPKGIDPVAEAIACSIVIEAGAQSVYLDLEPGDGTNFWTGSRDAALRFGEELRRLQPKAHIVVAPDARPWQAAKVPLDEFVAFSDEIAPQAYWRTFDTPANHTRMAQHGYPVGPAGVTPELIVNMTVDIFSRFGKPVSPIGQGNAPAEEWQRFLGMLIQRQGVKASVWRYGTSDPSVWDVIGQTLQTA
ncbi:MAG TPA: twin-arginine translocation signal domain-containing protein, partial [Dehalococcoidia bacterium]|nr:twin-arginine translocation signal domain-containing protein [Dehalococcoidia bacterium]